MLSQHREELIGLCSVMIVLYLHNFGVFYL